MSKVTISIDDTNPAIVAAYGEDSLIKVAEAMGYADRLPLPEDQWPEQETQEVTDTDGNTTTEPIPYTAEQISTPNPESAAEHVGKMILNKYIVPALTKKAEQKIETEAMAQAREIIAQGREAVKAAAEVTIE